MELILNLQLFAEGDAGGEADAGVTSADAGQTDRLRELGVPESKLPKPRSSAALPDGALTAVPPSGGEGRLSWDEIMADPEYNRRMQGVVQSRLKKSRDAQDALETLKPALSKLAREHGLSETETDYIKLTEAITGISIDSGKELKERDLQRVRTHLAKLSQEEQALKTVFPDFDLKAELRNPVFARLTAPGVKLSVEDAFYAVHHKELQTLAMQVTARKAAEKLSNSVRAGAMRPRENGAGAQAPSSLVFDYSKASPAQREAIKKRIRDAAASGQKVYPGGNVKTTP